jgi:regulator of RNase E activity RraA
MAKFKNDGTWYYIGNRDGLMVYVKKNDCIYVDKDGNVASSPEELEILKLANERMKKFTKE